MSERSGPPPIVFILAALALIGGGFWWFTNQPKPSASDVTSTIPGSGFTPPASVPGGTVVRIDGSTSMVTINQNLKREFEGQFSGTSVAANANGSDKGIQGLIAGTVDVAAVSRPLTSAEQNQGLQAVSVGSDAIALVVGNANPLPSGLTNAQVADIFQGKITDWSALGAPASPIRVLNRPPVSGTNKSFQELVLKGGNFGTTPNITTLPRDETTGLVRELKTDGIGYATFAQVGKQSTARVVAVDGVTPGAPNYPFQRQLFYVYKNPASPAVQAFLGYATSPQGQQVLAQGVMEP
jgi:phosphate transport system substrate-binding protein